MLLSFSETRMADSGPDCSIAFALRFPVRARPGRVRFFFDVVFFITILMFHFKSFITYFIKKAESRD